LKNVINFILGNKEITNSALDFSLAGFFLKKQMIRKYSSDCMSKMTEEIGFH